MGDGEMMRVFHARRAISTWTGEGDLSASMKPARGVRAREHELRYTLKER
jgi:hypothetical protein